MNSTPLGYRSVSIDDSFWSPRIRIVRERTIPYQYKQCLETGRIDAFRLEWKPGMDKQPHFFWDSDVAKWLEAASFSLGLSPDPELERLVDEVVDLIVSAQQPDGYLNTYFTVVEPEKRWRDLRDGHELYCAGHLIEAAVAHYEATGKRRLLDAMCRYADYIGSVFGTEPGKKRGYCGHEEIELALVKLYRLTDEDRYLRLSEYFILERGKSPNYFEAEARERGTPNLFDEWNAKAGITNMAEHTQSHLPVTEQTEAVGHAVRAMYLYCGMADIALEAGNRALLEACARLWSSVTEKRMYLTGGIGNSHHNEGFTRDYELPNETAYCETCAAIGLVLWSHRLLRLDCSRTYGDILERSLYNGVISGMSLDGEAYFYDNPLASRGDKHRSKWFGCSCCPPNIARLLASLGGYVYAQTPDEAIVHLYMQSEGAFELDGTRITLRQRTNYPWDGGIAFEVRAERSAAFALKLRIPGWCPGAKLYVNGEEAPFALAEDGYASIRREWQPGDVAELKLEMPVRRVYAHPDVAADAGRVAVTRGPLVYCFEQADNAAHVERLRLPRDAELAAAHEPGLLGGVTLLHGKAAAIETGGGDALYVYEAPRRVPADVTAIPYYAWDNRGPGAMQVWVLE